MDVERDLDQIADIICIKCSETIPYNPMSKCFKCLESEIDIGQFIPDTVLVRSCRLCGRFNTQRNMWVNVKFGTVPHIEFLLKLIPNLETVSLVDAAFTRLEPDAKRCHVAIKISKEVIENFTMQKTVPIIFKNKNHTCTECHRAEAQNFWRARIQIRQKVVHRKTFYYLEQLIMGNKGTHNILGAEKAPNGIDLFFSEKKFAIKLSSFIQTKVPCKISYSQSLITEDVKNSTANIKYTICIELAPICKNSVVFLPKKISEKNAYINRLCFCYKVHTNIHVIDPMTNQTEMISSKDYWNSPFDMVCDKKSLVKYVVVDIDKNISKLNGKNGNKPQGQGNKVKKNKKKSASNLNDTTQNKISASQTNVHHVSPDYLLAEATLMKESLVGQVENNQLVTCKTHLGQILHPGDVVYCIELNQINDDEIREYCNKLDQNVIIVEKDESEKRKERKRLRTYRLKKMDLYDDGETERQSTLDGTDAENEYEQFLQELEEDPEMRQDVLFYRNNEKYDRLSKEDKEKMLKTYTDLKLTSLFDDMNL